jgi:tetratricopeptide (TPR) repeat protein
MTFSLHLQQIRKSLKLGNNIMKKNEKTPAGYVKQQTAVIFVCLALGVGFLGGIALTIYKLDSGTSFGPSPAVQNVKGDRDGMLAALEDEVQRNPKNTDAWIQLGHIYFDRDEHAKAIHAYEKALELSPQNTDVITDLGIMYRRSGNPQKAVEMFDRVISIDPEHQNARFNKAVVLLHDLKDKKGAVAAWEGLLEINPAARAPNGQLVSDLIQQYR